MIEVKGLYKAFGKLEVLRGVDFTVQKGEVIGIIGPSGSGKSTLLRCINGIESATGGAIEIEGVDITRRGADLDAVRAKLGFVFQNFNLFPHMSVRDNLTLAPRIVRGRDKEEAEVSARELLERVGLSDKWDAYPNQLSGGQRQRVAIARALAMQPEYMLFDEPTSALDPEMIGEVLEVMRDLAKQGMTMAIVTHEMNFCREVATSVAFMDEGLIVEESPPAEFFDHPKSPRAVEFISKIL